MLRVAQRHYLACEPVGLRRQRDAVRFIARGDGDGPPRPLTLRRCIRNAENGRRVWHCPRREAAATGLVATGGGLDGSVDALADGVVGRSIDPPSNDAIGAGILDRLHAPPASRAKPRNA
jgi:hypothetical protein